MNSNNLDLFNVSPYYACAGVESSEERDVFFATFQSLSDPTKNFLISGETINTVSNLSENYDLSIEQTELVAFAIRNSVIGTLYIKNFPIFLTSTAEIDPNKATDIYEYVTKSLFAPISDDIKKIQLEKFGSKAPEPVISTTSIQSPSPVPPKPVFTLPVEPTPVLPVKPLQPPTPPKPKIIGEDLPETGGNIIDLRNKQ